MVTYYVTLFASLLINYLPHQHFCLCGIYVTTYVTPTMTSLIRLLCGNAVWSSTRITKRVDCALDVRITTKVVAKLKDEELVKDRERVQFSIKERNNP